MRPVAAHATGPAFEVLRETNVYREEARLPVLAWDDRLVPAARRHATDMSRRGYFAHESPEGHTLNDRLGHVMYRYQMVGENLALGQLTPQGAVGGWMGSPGHRENLLRPGFNRLGVAVVPSPRGLLWVQVFGRATPLSHTR